MIRRRAIFEKRRDNAQGVPMARGISLRFLVATTMFLAESVLGIGEIPYHRALSRKWLDSLDLLFHAFEKPASRGLMAKKLPR